MIMSNKIKWNDNLSTDEALVKEDSLEMHSHVMIKAVQGIIGMFYIPYLEDFFDMMHMYPNLLKNLGAEDAKVSIRPIQDGIVEISLTMKDNLVKEWHEEIVSLDISSETLTEEIHSFLCESCKKLSYNLERSDVPENQDSSIR